MTGSQDTFPKQVAVVVNECVAERHNVLLTPCGRQGYAILHPSGLNADLQATDLNILMCHFQATKGLKRPRFDSKQRLDHYFPIMSLYLCGPPRLLPNGHQKAAAETQWELHTSIQDRGFEYV